MSIEEGAITGSAAGFTPRSAGPLESKGRELGRKADEVGARLQTNLKEKAHELQETKHHLQERAGAAKQRLAQGVGTGRERVVEEVHAHPMRTVLWAVGIGAFVGLMLGRRSRR